MTPDQSFPHTFTTLRGELLEVCHRFADAAQGGTVPKIEEYLAEWKEPARSELLRELITLECYYLSRAGETVTADQFVERFPDDASLVQDVFSNASTMAVAGDGQSMSTFAGKSANFAPQSSATGRFGDYEILEELGKGGMGVVYKARQLSLNRLVALKMILSGQLTSAKQIAEFGREAQAAASLKHRGIVPIYDFGEVNNCHYYAMEFVEGASLKDAIPKHGMESRRAAKYAKGISEAVYYAHEKRVIHRDLKPANVLLDEYDEPRVADFGLAKQFEAGEGMSLQGDELAGTPAYMPPEQWEGREGRRSDVYAIGAILYTLLTGVPPFTGNQKEIMAKVTTQTPELPSGINADVDRDLETICLKCLEKEPRARYQTAQELAEDLDRFLRGETPIARRQTSPERVWRWCKRNPVVAGLSSAVVSVLILGIAVSSLLGSAAWKEATNAKAVNEKLKEINEQLEENRVDLKATNSKLTTALRDVTSQKERAERQEGLASVRLYATQIDAAQREWENGEVATAWHHLENCRWDLRGWEHDYLSALFNRDTLSGHSGRVLSVAFSPDGKRIVSGGGDATVRVWDASTGVETLTLYGHRYGVTNVAFIANGKHIISTSRSIRVWDADTGREMTTMNARSDHTLAVSPDGSRVVGDRGHLLAVWDVFSGREVLTLSDSANSHSLSFSPDGRRIVGARDNSVKVWNATTGEEVLDFVGHNGPVSCVAFSADGHRIVSGGGPSNVFDLKPNTIKVWDVTTGEEVHILKGHEGRVRSVAFSGDNRKILSGGADKTIRVWDATLGEPTLTMEAHDSITSVAFSPNYKSIVSAHAGGRTGEIKIWDAATGTGIDSRRVLGSVNSVAVSPDGKQIVSGTEATLTTWERASGNESVECKAHVPIWCVDFSPDGKLIASCDWDGMSVWNAVTGAQSFRTRGHSYVSCVAFSPDGKKVVSGSLDRTLTLWDAKGERLFTLKGHEHSVQSVAFSPDGQRIVSGGEDGTVRVWDANKGEETLELKESSAAVNDVAFSRDGQRIVGGYANGVLTAWNATTGKRALKLAGHSKEVFSVDFSPDGTRLVSGGGDSTAGEVKVWDAKNGEEVLSLVEQHGPVRNVAFSPEGERIIGCGWDRTLKVWGTDTGEALHSFIGHTGVVYSAVFSPDGEQVVSGSLDGTVRVWNAMTGKEVRNMKTESKAIRCVAASSEGKLISGACDDGSIHVWNSTRGDEILTMYGTILGVTSIAFDSEGKRIVSCGRDGTLKVWDVNTGEELFATQLGHVGNDVHRNANAFLSAYGRQIASTSGGPIGIWDVNKNVRICELKGHAAGFSCLRFSANGQTVVSGDGDGMLRIWDIKTCKKIFTRKAHNQDVHSVAISPDGSHVASSGGFFSRVNPREGSGIAIKVFDVHTGEEIRSLTGHVGRIVSIAYASDGERIVSGSTDGTVRVWDSATGVNVLTLKTDNVSQVEFSPDGSRLFGTGEFVDVWDGTQSGECRTMAGHSHHVCSVAISPDGEQIVSTGRDDTFKVWDIDTGQEILVLKGYAVCSASFSPDGKRIVGGCATTPNREKQLSTLSDRGFVTDRVVSKIWDTTMGEEILTLKGAIVDSHSLFFAPNGQQIVGATHGTVNLWDAATGEIVRTLSGHSRTVKSVAFSSDGQRIVSGDNDGTLVEWDAATGRELLSINGKMAAIQSVAFSPDGKRIVSGTYESATGRPEHMVRIWDALSGEEILRLRGHGATRGVKAVAFSPDGNRIVGGGMDYSLRLWDAKTGEEVRTLVGHTAPVTCVVFHPDGERIVSGSEDNTVKVWRAQLGQPGVHGWSTVEK